MASNDELACVYSALILQDNASPVTADKLQTLLKAASVDVEPFWPGLFAKATESLSLKDLVSNVGAGAESSAPAAVATAPIAEAKEEEKKEDEEEEEDEDMGFALFD